MNNLTFKQLDAVINDYDLILFDLWGVIVEGDETYDGVVEKINQIMGKTNIAFLTNAPRASFRSAQILRNFGIHKATEDIVITSGDISRNLMNEHSKKLGRPSKIYHLGEDRNPDLLVQFEYEIANNLDEADILLLSIFRDEHENINEFDDLLKQAAKSPNLLILCSNPDTLIPKHGITRYCAGYFASKIEKFGGNVIYTGKPKKIIYDYTLQKYSNIDKNRVLMVGDTLDTDILGANQAGIHSALVLTGNAAPIHRMHNNMHDKLNAITKKAREAGMMPSFVMSIL